MYTYLVSILSLALVCYHSQSVSSQRVEPNYDDRPFVSLPEPFNDEKLLTRKFSHAENSTKIECHKVFGCYQKMPIGSLFSQDPMTIRSQFSVFSRLHRSQPGLIKQGNYTYCRQSAQNDQQCVTSLPFEISELRDVDWNPQRRTIILIGGYLSSDQTDWELAIKDAWLDLEDVNVIIAGWSGGNKWEYAKAAVNTRAVARHVTVMLYYLSELHQISLNSPAFTDNVYIIGHSLGSHIAGFIGQDFNGRIGRITGLDPAGPRFDNLPSEYRLERSDAQLVDALHTNAGASLINLNQEYGTQLTNGHVDLFANDGKHQPGSKLFDDTKGFSHGKASKYYAAFLKHELLMRRQLGCIDCSLYRLRAYASDSFEQFRDGSSFRKKCPTSVINDADLEYTDLDECSMAVDYVSRFDIVRKELVKKNHLDLDSNPPKQNKYYFFSSRDTDEQLDHYLLKVKIKREKTEPAAMEYKYIQLKDGLGCNFNLTVQLDQGHQYQQTIEGLQPQPTLEYYEILVPYLSPNKNTKISLAKLDAEDFYLNSTDDNYCYAQMRHEWTSLIPTKIVLHGLGEDALYEAPVVEKKGYVHRAWDWAKSWLYGSDKTNTRQRKTDDNEVTVDSGKPAYDPRCIQPIEEISIMPLRKMHRHLVATYTRLGRKDPPIKVFESNENGFGVYEQPREGRRIDLDSGYFCASPDCYGSFLDTIRIGPYDSSLNLPSNDDVNETAKHYNEEEDYPIINKTIIIPDITTPQPTTVESDAKTELQENTTLVAKFKPEHELSDGSPPKRVTSGVNWMVLFILETSIFVVIVATVAVLKLMRKPYHDDRSNLIDNRDDYNEDNINMKALSEDIP